MNLQIDKGVRLAGSVEFGFPYRGSTVCYVLVEPNRVSNPSHRLKGDLATMAEVCRKVKCGEAQLFAVWPGQYRSDLFWIDNIDQLADAFGIVL